MLEDIIDTYDEIIISFFNFKKGFHNLSVIYIVGGGFMAYNYYKEIKETLVNNEIYKKVKDYSKNRNDLESYYKVGKLLSDALWR